MKTQNLFTQNLAEISVSYSHKVRPSEMITITSSQDAYDVFKQAFDEQLEYIEYFYMILLSRASKVIGYYQVSKGGLSGTVCDPKCIFQVALKCCACSIIVAHNHPSGNTKPSEMDIRLTKRLKEVGTLLELPLLDHIILTRDTYFSFADEGLL